MVDLWLDCTLRWSIIGFLQSLLGIPTRCFLRRHSVQEVTFRWRDREVAIELCMTLEYTLQVCWDLDLYISDRFSVNI